MVEAAYGVLLDPAGGELRAAMRAFRCERLSRAAFAAIEREILVHDLDRDGAAGLEVSRQIDRMPEEPQIAAHECVRAREQKILRPERRAVRSGGGRSVAHGFNSIR